MRGIEKPAPCSTRKMSTLSGIGGSGFGFLRAAPPGSQRDVCRSVRRVIRLTLRAKVGCTLEAAGEALTGRGDPGGVGEALEARGHVRRDVKRPRRRRHGRERTSRRASNLERDATIQRSKNGRLLQ